MPEHFGVAFQFALDVAGDGFAFAGEFEKRVEIVGQAGDLLVVFDGFFEALAILHDLLAVFGLGPEVGRGDLLFGAVYSFFFLDASKITPDGRCLFTERRVFAVKFFESHNGKFHFTGLASM